jgi:ribosomal protein L11 methyltransferase
MQDYTKYTIDCQEDMREIAIAMLGETEGLDMFTETETGVEAFGSAAHDRQLVESALDELCEQFGFAWKSEELKTENWNSAWESNFPKVKLDHFCSVRAEFHDAEPDVEYDIVIQPKMAFGTGHHQTTRMMLSAMREVDFRDKSVFDYGCGTAVLAILAAKRGANDVLGVDNELPAAESSLENVIRNGCPEIQVIHGTLDDVPQRTYDVILANINRNIILQSLERLHTMCTPNALMFTSGFLVSDAERLIGEATKYGFTLEKKYQEDDWNCLVFRYKS